MAATMWVEDHHQAVSASKTSESAMARWPKLLEDKSWRMSDRAPAADL